MSYLLLQGDARRLPMADRSVDLVIGSPPYVDARLYLEDGQDLGISRDCPKWVEWMLDVTTEAVRVARNCVIWIAAGVTRDRTYWPACEGLMWEWFKRGGSAYRPCYWHRVGIPGSGGDDWFRADVEYAMCFKRPGKLAYSDNTAMGHPPKWAPGGEMSHRLTDGTRRNQLGGHERKRSSSRRKDVGHESGTDMEEQFYVPPVLANPGTLIQTTVGGGQMGHPLAHANEAPFPEDIPEFFIRSLTRPGDIVLDPFGGSGTTVAVAERLGRHGIGVDLRRSQHQIARQRLERPHQPVVRPRADEVLPLFAGSSSTANDETMPAQR